MARRFSLRNLAEALGELEVGTATEIASKILGVEAGDDDRRAVNKVLLDNPDRFVQRPDRRWVLMSAPVSPPVQAMGTSSEQVFLDNPAEARASLVDALLLDLIGPGSDDEVIEERPTIQYLIGALLPGDAPLDPDAEESIEVQAEETATASTSTESVDADEIGTEVRSEDEPSAEEPLPSTEALSQSSIGLSFAVEPGQTRVRCSVRYGTYAPGSGQTQGKWQRTSHRTDLALDLNQHRSSFRLPAEAELVATSRAVGDGRSVTVFLVNRRVKGDGRPDDTECLFQPEIRIDTEDGAATIVHRPSGRTGSDPDVESNRLLYRHAPEFAAGHGCAVDWAPAVGVATNAIWTTLVPSFETPSVSAESRDVGEVRMDDLATESSAAGLGKRLRVLTAAYRKWITEQERGRVGLPADLLATAQTHLELCIETAERMEAGIDLVEADQNVRRAFQLANRAMSSQRLHALQAQAFRRTGTRPALGELPPPAWRPFQLAFILLNLVGVGDRLGRERQIVDLLWFPTGGGKTEAYLGLSAFAIFLRRLRASGRTAHDAHGGSGVTVLMRYTLRLLTVQQFQRATSLVCAMDLLRRSNMRELGADPISIGLWVGQKTSPNNYKDAKSRLADLAADRKIADSNPLHITSCPWCGAGIGIADYTPVDELERVLVHCPSQACEFHGVGRDESTAIPATVVDDDIYARCPSIVIGTVDKFARMPWTAATMALFGRVDQFCSRHGFVRTGDRHGTHRAKGRLGPASPVGIPSLEPPDLIIQDELHLITGPLGTLTGIYESAIAFLSAVRDERGGRIGPKIIASTATIRRADDQVRALFARQTRRFPAAGLEVSDSFFARQVSTEQTPGRLYVGIYAPGRSGKTVLVRVMAQLLQTAFELRTRSGAAERADHLDPYWTLVGYFNSLRELGGASRLVDDDIRARIELLAQRSQTPARVITNPQELTSRVGPERVPEILRELEQPMASGRAVDTLLATNMIQVGVDVDRLGLMVVAGQPKTSAEYIQATSRVGRAAPGLVLTVLNWTRPRDISHYERFTAYHAALYRHVEGASLTPMSARSRDRALPGVLVAMVRLGRDGWAGNQDAVRFEASDPLVGEAREFLIERARTLDPDEVSDTQLEFFRLADIWDRLANPAVGLRYANPFRQKVKGKVLLKSAEDALPEDEGFRVLNSLRDVETESELRLVSRNKP